MQQIADFAQGGNFIDPAAFDHQVAIFNKNGLKITGSIMSQNAFPGGTLMTIAGSQLITADSSVNGNLSVLGNSTIGLNSTDNIILNGTTSLLGPIRAGGFLAGTANRILISQNDSTLVWQDYAAGLTFQGAWNALINDPTLTDGVGVNGHFYVVDVPGTTSLDGNTDWQIGDWALFSGVTGAGGFWDKIDNTQSLTGTGTANTLTMWTDTDVVGNSLVSQNNAAVIISGSGGGDGKIQLNCSVGTHGVIIQSPPHSQNATYTLVLPSTVGTANQVLASGGAGAQLLWRDVDDEKYDLSAGTKVGTSVPLNLTSGSGTDNSAVNLTEGTGITLTQTSATEITIAGTAQGVTGSGTGQVLSKFSGTGTGKTVLEDSKVSEANSNYGTTSMAMKPQGLGSGLAVMAYEFTTGVNLASLDLSTDNFRISTGIGNLTDLSVFRLRFDSTADADIFRTQYGVPPGAFGDGTTSFASTKTFTFNFSNGATVTFTHPAGPINNNFTNGIDLGRSYGVVPGCVTCGPILTYVSGSGTITISPTTSLNALVSTISVEGELDMSTNQIKNVVNPTSAQDAATKNYVDNIDNVTGSGTINKLPKFGTTTSLVDSIASEVSTIGLVKGPGNGGGTINFFGRGPCVPTGGGSTSCDMLNVATVDFSSDPFGNVINDGKVSFIRWVFSSSSEAVAFRTKYGVTPNTQISPCTRPGTIASSVNVTITFQNNATITFSVPSGDIGQACNNQIGFGTYIEGQSNLNGQVLTYISGSGSISTGDTLVTDVVISIAGELDMSTHKIKNVVNPTIAQDAATKNYVDTEITTALSGTLVFRGTFNAATGAITSGANSGSQLYTGTAGVIAIAKGDFYIADTAGSFYGSLAVNVGEEAIALSTELAGASVFTDWSVVPAVGGVVGTGTQNFVTKWNNAGGTSIGNSVIFDNGTNVGMGTNAPISGFKLDVVGGDLRVADDATNGFEAGYSAGGSSAFIQGYNRAVGGGFIDMLINNSVTVKASGNVGIGFTASTEKLVVAGSINSSAQSTSFVTGPQRAMMDLISSSKIARIGTVQGTETATGTQGEVSFIVNNAEKMRLTSTGALSLGSSGTGYGTSGQVLTSTGNASPTWQAGSTITGTGAATQVTFWDATSNLNGDAKFNWDNTNKRLGIGSVTNLGTKTMLMVIDTSDARKQIEFSNNATYRGSIGHDAGTGRNEYRTEATTGKHAFFRGAATTNTDLFIDGAGDVGIGTDTPDRKLHVEGNNAIARLESTGAGQNAQIDFKILNFSTIWSIGSNISLGNTGALEFNLSGTTKVMMNTAGNVGIGNNFVAPLPNVNADNLVIGNTTNNDNGITIATTNTGTASVYFQDAASTSGGFIDYNHSSDLMRFGTNSAERMLISSAGVLTLKGYQSAGTLVTNAAGVVSIQAGGGEGGPYLPLSGGTLTGNLTGTSVTFTGVVSLDGTNQIYFVPQAGESNNEAMRIVRSSDTMFFTYGINAPDTAFSFNSLGNMNFAKSVGIGTGTPSALLEIQTVGTSGSQDFQIFSRGVSPNYEVFKISRSAGSTELLANQNLTLSADYDANHTSVDSNIIFKTDNTEKVRIASTGNVGVGTAAPDTALTVDGSISLSYNATQSFQGMKRGAIYTETEFYNATTSEAARPLYNFTNSVGGSNLVITQGGNIGIGTLTPDALLNVESPNVDTARIRLGCLKNDGSWAIGNTIGSLDFFSADASGPGAVIRGSVSMKAEIASGADMGMAFATYNNTERMRIAANGNVGIGSNAPASKLTLLGNTNSYPQAPVIRFDSTATQANVRNWGIGPADSNPGNFHIYKSGAIGNNPITGDGAKTFTIDYQGNVGIGTDTPGALLQVQAVDGVTGAIEVKGGPINGAVGTINSELNFGANDTSVTGGIGGSIKSVNETTNGALAGMSFYTYKQNRSPGPDLKEAMRLTNAGQFLVNQTTANTDADGFGVYPLGSSGGTLVNCYNGDDGIALRVGINSVSSSNISTLFVVGSTSAGSISHANSNSTSFNTTSDYRLKEDLQDFNGLDMISDIPVYDFKWKSDESRSYGVMAHELQEVLPDAVTGEKDAEETQQVDYSKIVPLLVKSIQELKAEIELLKAR
jgi:hypothetical protein